MSTFRLVAIPDADLEVCDWGAGEPVVFVQTGLTANELLPLASDPQLDAGFRKIAYHRRGYAGSSQTSGDASISRDARDCHGLMEALSIERAHVVGLSYSGAVGLELAAAYPSCVHTLALIEPPPVHTPSADEFRALNHRLLETRRKAGPDTALDEFLGMVIGPDWRSEVERVLPGAAAQMQRDTATFFDTDLPALLSWRFGPDDARTVTCPVLHIGASDSGRFFTEVRELILRWFPTAEDVVIDGADHGLALSHPAQIAAPLADFLHRHPMTIEPA